MVSRLGAGNSLRITVVALLLIGLFGTGVAHLAAQGAPGTIPGTICDTSRAAVPYASPRFCG